MNITKGILMLRKLQKEPHITLEEAIKKGAAVLSDNNDKKWAFFSLRIRKDISNDIDADLEKRIGISKTAWILEAIQEKLKKDSIKD